MSHFKCAACRAVVGEARYYYTDLCPECEEKARKQVSAGLPYCCDVCESPISATDYFNDHCDACERALLERQKKRTAFEVYESIGSAPEASDLDLPVVNNEDARRALRVFERDSNDADAWRLSAASTVQRDAFGAESKWAMAVLRELVAKAGGAK